MTDLHVHILPGVDDGSPNLSTSLEMAEMAAQSGVRILAVTPHANQTGIEGVEDGYVNYESEQLEEQFYRLEREINREHIPISLVRGMEIMSIGPLGEKIRERKLIPLHESRYYLIEAILLWYALPASARLQPQKKHPRPDFTLPFLRWLTLCAMRDGAALWNPQAKIRT